MRIHTTRFLLLLLFSVCFISCASFDSPNSKRFSKKQASVLPLTSEMKTAFEVAERLYYASKMEEAVSAYKRYLHDFQENQFTGKAQFRLGEIHFRSRNFQGALSHYEKALSDKTENDWRWKCVYKKAVTHSKLSQFRKVLDSLDQLPWADIRSGFAVRAGSLRVFTALRLNDVEQSRKGFLEVLDGYENPEKDNRDLEDQDWIISSQRSLNEVEAWIRLKDEGENISLLVQWMKNFEGRVSGAHLSWKIATLYHQRGEYSQAASWVRSYLQLYPKHVYATEARTLLAELDKRGGIEGARSVIGVILPLSGNFSIYGQSALHGIECAGGVFEPCSSVSNVHLLIRDSQGDPGQARLVMEEFVVNPEVKAVVGPLLSSEVDATIEIAEQAGLPLLALSQKEDIPKKGEFIFRNFLTVQDQVETLVGYACSDLKKKKFAILRPDHEAGLKYEVAYSRAVEECGGQMIAKETYNSSSNSLVESLRKLKFSSVEQTAESVPFEVLFVPDTYKRVSSLFSAMEFLRMGQVLVLGGAGWNNPELAEIESPLIKQAVFVDGFSMAPGHSRSKNFADNFSVVYGFPPTFLEAYSFDTIKILEQILIRSPEITRNELKAALVGMKKFDGVTGDISVSEEGEAVRKLRLLKIEQQKITEVH